MTMLDALRERRAILLRQMGELDERVNARIVTDGGNVTEVEHRHLVALDTELNELNERIAEMETFEQRQAAAAGVATGLGLYGGWQSVGGARVRSEATTYNERAESSWILDNAAVRGQLAGVQGIDRGDAELRLQRHAQELQVETRDTTSASYGGLVPPVYLVNEFTANLRAARPFANLCTGLALPETGMSVVIPRGTAGTTVSTQATQNSAPTTTDVTVTDLTVPVNTVQGRAVLSRQAAERGGLNIDRIVFADLAADAARYMDQQALFGSGAGGNATGAVITAGIITVTQTATTGIGTLGAIANAAQQINTQRFFPPDVIVMHPRRWGWLTVQVDTAGRPLVTVESGQLNVFGQGDAAATQTVVGTLLGIPVVTDPNLRINLGAGTNQDEIIVCRRSDLYLWEQPGTVREFVFEQPVGPQSVQLAVYGNFAFSAARYPTAVAYISGVGLVTPTFP